MKTAENKSALLTSSSKSIKTFQRSPLLCESSQRTEDQLPRKKQETGANWIASEKTPPNPIPLQWVRPSCWHCPDVGPWDCPSESVQELIKSNFQCWKKWLFQGRLSNGLGAEQLFLSGAINVGCRGNPIMWEQRWQNPASGAKEMRIGMDKFMCWKKSDFLNIRREGWLEK